MSNVLVTCSLIAKESLAILENMLGFSANVNRDWEDEFKGNQSRGYSPGATINIKKPPRYTYRAGRVAVPQATTETTVPLTVNQGGVDLNFTGFERTLSVQQFEQKMMAGVATIANEIDRQGLDLARTATFNTLNPTGALPATQLAATQVFTSANQRLDEMGAPRDKQRAFILGPALNGAAVSGLAGLFNNPATISSQYGKGMMVDSLGFNIAMDQNVATQVNGAATATNIAGAGQTGSTITVAAVAGGTLTKGTTITLPGVFAVNPQSRVSTNVLANFVVTADVLVGATSIPISPAIVTSGAFQNVTASPTTAQPYVIQGAASTSYQANVAYHKDAFTLAMVPMFAPPGGKGVVDVAQMSHNGFTVKATTFYDGVNDNYITRLDVLFGWAATYSELSVKYYTV
jgi:hypothetical protein